jgi:hypothetical protein
LSKRKAVRFAIRFAASVAVFGAAAVILVGLSTFAMRSSRALPLDGALDDEPQTTNRAIKSNRLSLLPMSLRPSRSLRRRRVSTSSVSTRQ